MNIYHEKYYVKKSERFIITLCGCVGIKTEELIMYRVRDNTVFQHFFLPWEQPALEVVLKQMLQEENE